MLGLTEKDGLGLSLHHDEFQLVDARNGHGPLHLPLVVSLKCVFFFVGCLELYQSFNLTVKSFQNSIRGGSEEREAQVHVGGCFVQEKFKLRFRLIFFGLKVTLADFFL